jgi:ComF family protein
MQNTFIDRILDWLLPAVCISCERVGSKLCLECRETKVKYYSQQECHVCRGIVQDKSNFVHTDCAHMTLLDGVIVAVKYNTLIETLIKEVKYDLFYKTTRIWTELSSKNNQILKTLNLDYLVPIPIHRKKRWYRGFNQAELFANLISVQTGIDTIKILERTKDTKTQVGMSKTEREKNLTNAFDISDMDDISDLDSVCLIDDVMTTGTTLEESAKKLKKLGINKIYALVLARG